MPGSLRMAVRRRATGFSGVRVQRWRREVKTVFLEMNWNTSTIPFPEFLNTTMYGSHFSPFTARPTKLPKQMGIVGGIIAGGAALTLGERVTGLVHNVMLAFPTAD